MTIAGFPDSLQFSRMSAAISDLKARSEEARIEVVTGRVADAGKALGARTGDAHLIQKSIADLEQFRLSANRGLSRAAITQQVISRVAEPTALLGADLLGALSFSDEAGIRLASTRARNDLETAVSGFNQRYEGRALFSGDATDRAALGPASLLISDIAALYTAAPDAAQFEADLDFYFNDPAGGFATSYYTGGVGDAPHTQLSEGETANASAKANEVEIRNVLRGLAGIVVAGSAPASTKRNEALDNAGRGVVSAGAALTEVQARVGVAEARLQDGLARLDIEELVFTQSYSELVGRDPYEAASRLQQLETQLAASFTLSARISRLSLVNFL